VLQRDTDEAVFPAGLRVDDAGLVVDWTTPGDGDERARSRKAPE